MRASAAEESCAFRSVRRSCYAGLDSIKLREEAARRIASAIAFDAFHFAETDPDTGLFTHAVAEGLPTSLNAVWLEHLYPFRVAAEIVDMARSGTSVATTPEGVVMEVLRPEGFAHDLRTVLCGEGDPWGFICLLRGHPSPGFSAREKDFMRRVVPHLSRGLRTAQLLERAREEADSEDGPGVLVLDGRGRVVTSNASAVAFLEDLTDVGRGSGAIPYAVSSVVAQLNRSHGGAAVDEAAGLSGLLRVHGRSGRWYTLRASLAEPDPSGSTATIVVIETARKREVAALLTRLYGLTPREREILALVAKGRSTKVIAGTLRISPYTVQEHLGNACAKVGVRTRRELVAKFFFDGYAPKLRGANGGDGTGRSASRRP